MPQGNTSLGNTSAGCSPSSPRLPPLQSCFPSRASWVWELLIWSPVDQICIENKSLAPWDSDRLRGIYEEGSSWEVTSAREHLPQSVYASSQCAIRVWVS